MRLNFLFLILFSITAMATEEPKFTLVKKDGPFEVREYAEKIIAQVEVEGSYQDATSRGFKLLADFIFGNNTNPSLQSDKIEMTAPVISSIKNKEIEMTAPVISEKDKHKWLISFVMPSEYSLDTLPKPNNADVKIIALEIEKYAVIVFSGLVRESSFEEKITLLKNYVEENNFIVDGNVQIARYNPPWTLPFFRRNELLLKIK
ncbi:MAG: SOUL family heme-binding protein [Methylophilaceae bacterium]